MGVCLHEPLAVATRIPTNVLKAKYVDTADRLTSP